MELVAVCPLALEDVAAAEMRALGLDVRGVRVDEGVIEWEGETADLWTAHLHLACVERIAARAASFHATNFAELRRKAARVEWERWLLPGQALRLRVTSRASRLYHEGAVAERVAAGLGDRLGAAPPVVGAEAPGRLVLVRLEKDRVTVSIDASGEALHRRGWRLATAKAPLRETLAAALLRRAGWDRAAPLADPFCGAGTFCIEAARWAAGLLPGADRSFAFEDWPGHDAAAWAARRAAAGAAPAPPPPPVLGRDRESGALRAALANAERAGVADRIDFARATVSALDLGGLPPGWVVTNPPYGLRTGEAASLERLYAAFGRVLRERAPRWRVLMLCPNARLGRAVGLPWRIGPWIHNGGVRVRLLEADIPA